MLQKMTSAKEVTDFQKVSLGQTLLVNHPFHPMQSNLGLLCGVVLCVKFDKVVAPSRASMLCSP